MTTARADLNLNDDGDPRGVYAWLRSYPEFIDKPASIEEFLGPQYLNLGDTVRPGVRQALIDIFGDEVRPDRISKMRRGMFTGGIGVGKTTFASICIPYMVHYVLCLKDPQHYFGLMPGSRIAFMLMSTTDSQAKEVLFGDLKAKISLSPWFRTNHYLFDPKWTNQLRFPRDIWVLPGNSAETTFEGYNILGGIIDEGDSHKITDRKDYASAGWETIHSRIASRFTDPVTKQHRGLLIAIGQMKSANGFMARKKRELDVDEHAVVVQLKIWESFGWDKYRNKDGKFEVFWYDIDRREEVTAEYARDVKSSNIIPIPTAYKLDFELNPVKALRDLAGIPPESTDPFIVLMDRVDTAMEKWAEFHDEGYQPVNTSCVSPVFHQDLRGDSMPRALHIDMAYSDAATADAMGLAMGHVSHLVEFDGEIKPIIMFDFVLRIKAKPGSQIVLADIRKMIYYLRDERGFRIKQVTLDGVESLDTIQTLRKSKFSCDKLSVDKNKAPYEDLRDAIYERRALFPKYMTERSPGDRSLVDIIRTELSQLSDVGRKVDHGPGGSKDTTDAMAAVVHVLQGRSRFKRGASLLEQQDQVRDEYGDGYDPEVHHTIALAEIGREMDDLTAEELLGKSSDRSLPGMDIPSIPRGMPALEANPFGLDWQ